MGLVLTSLFSGSSLFSAESRREDQNIVGNPDRIVSVDHGCLSWGLPYLPSVHNLLILTRALRQLDTFVATFQSIMETSAWKQRLSGRRPDGRYSLRDQDFLFVLSDPIEEVLQNIQLPSEMPSCAPFTCAPLLAVSLLGGLSKDASEVLADLEAHYMRIMDKRGHLY